MIHKENNEIAWLKQRVEALESIIALVDERCPCLNAKHVALVEHEIWVQGHAPVRGTEVTPERCIAKIEARSFEAAINEYNKRAGVTLILSTDDGFRQGPLSVHATREAACEMIWIGDIK